MSQVKGCSNLHSGVCDVHPDIFGDFSNVLGSCNNKRGIVSPKLYGDFSLLSGNVSGVVGNASGKMGDVTPLYGDISLCEGHSIIVLSPETQGIVRHICGQVGHLSSRISGWEIYLNDPSGEHGYLKVPNFTTLLAMVMGDASSVGGINFEEWFHATPWS